MEKLAVIGMGCLFPGGDSPELFYQSLLDQQDSLSNKQPFNIGLDRFTVPMDNDKLSRLGDNFINVSYIVHEALRSSGYLQDLDVLKRTGLIMGNRESFSEDEFHLFGAAYYAELEKNIRLLLDDERFKFDYTMGQHNDFHPLGVFNFSYPTIFAAQSYSIQGPAFAFDAACASSLYSIEMAAAYLNANKVDMMIAGAVFFGLGNDALPKFFDGLGVTAKPGTSRPLDKNSGGMIPNEGGGAVVLKRLSDAERDGDEILAVIDAVGWSNSGRGKQVLAPSHRGQLYAYEDAFRQLAGEGVVECDIDYIECHATGTAVGDIVELNSLEEHYEQKLRSQQSERKPLFGALKGNIGHLLTGSSIASLIKIILSMKHGKIPATYDVKNPMSSENGFFDRQNMVVENTLWPSRNFTNDEKNHADAQAKSVKRAAINGFGFGGSNAHLIISDYQPGIHNDKRKRETKNNQSITPVSITGLSCHVADLSDKKQVSDSLFYARTPNKKKTTNRLKGLDTNERVIDEFVNVEALQNKYYFSEYEFDFLKNGVHPGEESESVNKEYLLLKMADKALEDAGFSKGDPLDIAVIVAAKQSLFQLPFGFQVYLEKFIPQACKDSGIELSAEALARITKITREALLSPRASFDLIASAIGPIIANRISLVWNLIAPSMKLCCLENSMAQSLELAQIMLHSRDLEAVLIGVIDSDPILEAGIWHEKYGEEFGLSMRGVSHGEGVAAFVVQKTQQAQQQQQYIYADVNNVVMKRGDELSEPQSVLAELLDESYPSADLSPRNLGYLEVSGDLQRNQTRQLLNSYEKVLDDSVCDVGSAALNFGQSMIMSSASSLLKSLMMLDSQFKPKAITAETNLLKQWPYKNLRLNDSSQFWMNVDRANYVALATAGFNNSYSHIILSKQRKKQNSIDVVSSSTAQQNLKKSFYKRDDAFIVARANNIEKLQLELEFLLGAISPHTVIATLKRELLERYQSSYPLSAVFVAENLSGVIEEIESLQAYIKAQVQSEFEWQTNRGSYFTSDPLALEGGVCVCYPPSGLSTPSTVYELISTVPEVNIFLQDSINKAHPEVRKTLTSLDEHQKSKHELPIFMDGLVGGLSSELLFEVIGVDPDAFIGLSFGELVMNSATDVYSEHEDADFIVDLVSPFIKRLSDPKFIFNYFNDEKFQWSSFFCTGDGKRIDGLRSWVDTQTDVFLTIDASPTNIIISGRRELCERGAKQNNCLAYPISDDIFVHTPLAMKFYDEIIATNFKHPYVVNDKKKAIYYKTFDATKFNFTKEEFAKNVADCICKPIKFKAVLEKAYEDGARLFIGLDGGDLCTNWIDENLTDRKIKTLGFKSRGMDFNQSLYTLTAKLLSHGVNLDVARLYGFSVCPVKKPTVFDELYQKATTKSLVKIISNEPATLADSMLQEKHYEFFKRSSVSAHSNPASVKKLAEAEITTIHSTESKNIAAENNTALTTDESVPQQTLLLQLYTQNALMQEKFLKLQSDYTTLYEAQLTGQQLSLGEIRNSSAHHSESITEQQAPKYGYAKTCENKHVIWDEELIHAVTLKDLSSSWGSAYKPADDYLIRVRLPAPPFMFVSRIIGLQAQFGELKPSMIEMEYDIPKDAWYLCRGYMPASIATESSHVGILLLSYIGIDVMFEGKLRFRAVDSSFTAFSDRLLCAGDTCRGSFKITSLMQHKGAVLVFYTYNLYTAEGERLFQIKGLGGLFSEEELELVRQNKDVAKLLAQEMQKDIAKSSFDYPLQPSKHNFNEKDLEYVQSGRNDLCFGSAYEASYEHEQMYPPQFRVLRRITHLDLCGGDYGLGVVKGEADIDPEHWVFDSHFPHDPILPATFTIEGAVQLMVFFFHASGLIQNKQGHYLEPRLLQDQVSTFKFRDGVKRHVTQVQYEAMIRSINIDEQILLYADVRIYNEGKLIAYVDNIAFTVIAPDVVQVKQLIN